MMRYLIVLYLGFVSVLLVDPNPLYALPLVLVLISFMFDRKWIGFFGVGLFTLVTLGKLGSVDLGNIGIILLHSAIVLVPLVGLLELVLSPKPYRLERLSGYPIMIAFLLLTGAFSAVFVITRVQKIGLYLEADPILQVFMIISLSIFFFGPPLLSRSDNEQDIPSGHHIRPAGDKNE